VFRFGPVIDPARTRRRFGQAFSQLTDPATLREGFKATGETYNRGGACHRIR